MSQNGALQTGRVVAAMAGKCGERMCYGTHLTVEAEAPHTDMPSFRRAVSDSVYARRSQAAMGRRTIQANWKNRCPMAGAALGIAHVVPQKSTLLEGRVVGKEYGLDELKFSHCHLLSLPPLPLFSHLFDNSLDCYPSCLPTRSPSPTRT